MRPYTKHHASPNDRIKYLISKGLIAPRQNVAVRKIESIGYERLRIYFLSHRDQPDKTFRPGTTYEDILQLYECDVRLREASFKAVGRSEIAFNPSSALSR